MVGDRRRRTAAAWLGAAVVAGCQSSGGDGTPLLLTQTPPTVQAAFDQYHDGSTIRQINRKRRGGEDYYTVDYTSPDGSKHDVVYNGAGNEIDRH